MRKKIKDFFIKKFFFLIDNEEKQLIRDKVMENDHRMYKVLLVILMITEFIMLLVNFIRYGVSTNEVINYVYRSLYIFLFLSSFVLYIVMEHFYQKKTPFKYFIFVSLLLLSVMLWGVGISLCDSYDAKTIILTYYAITLITTSAFLTLEPWVPCLGCAISTIIFNVLYFTIPQFNAVVEPLYITEIIVIFALCVITSTFNFTRRIDAIRLQIQVSNMNTALSQKAIVDDLTHVYNRRYLTEIIDNPLDYNENGSGIIMLDIDHFKNLNDTFGHQVGDQCLSMLGKAINNLTRDKDSYCVRYGGEEFLIFFKKITKEELQEEAELLRKRIEKMRVSISGGVQVKYTISAGLAKAEDGISYNSLINQADEALYRAKETRNTVSF